MNNKPIAYASAVFLFALIFAGRIRTDLTVDGVYEQKFSDGHCFDKESAGDFEVTWCPENQNHDSKNGNIQNGDPKGCARVDTGKPGARLWYHFKGAAPSQIHVAFEHAIPKPTGSHLSPTTGYAQYQTSMDTVMNCPTNAWKDGVDLNETWDPHTDANQIFAPDSFDITVGAQDKGVYIQFIKPKPSDNAGIVMSIDNVVITPTYPATQPATRPTGSR